MDIRLSIHLAFILKNWAVFDSFQALQYWQHQMPIFQRKCKMFTNSDVQLWIEFLTINLNSANQEYMNFAFIVIGSIFLHSYWVSDNVLILWKVAVIEWQSIQVSTFFLSVCVSNVLLKILSLEGSLISYARWFTLKWL